MKRLCTLILLLCTALAHATTSVLILGDSLSAGYGLQPGQGYVDLMRAKIIEAKLDVNIVNASVSGETAQEGLTKMPDLLTANHPDIVIIALGSNDGLRNYPILQIRSTIGQMIVKAQETNARVLLIGFELPLGYDQNYRAAFQAIFPHLSSEYSVPLVPFLLDGFAGDANYFQADHIQPTAEAQPMMLNNVWQYLAPMLGVKTARVLP